MVDAVVLEIPDNLTQSESPSGVKGKGPKQKTWYGRQLEWFVDKFTSDAAEFANVIRFVSLGILVAEGLGCSAVPFSKFKAYEFVADFVDSAAFAGDIHKVVDGSYRMTKVLMKIANAVFLTVSTSCVLMLLDALKFIFFFM